MRDVLIFLSCVAGGLALGWATVRNAMPDKPAWPLLVYLILMDGSWMTRDYSSRRKTFSRREQFLASAFVWFFILFLLCVILFGCHSRQGCVG